MLNIADTSVCAVGIERCPLAALRAHLCAELSARSRLVDALCLWVDSSTCKAVLSDVLAKGCAVYALERCVEQASLVKLAKDSEDTAGAVALLNRIFLCVWRKLAEERNLTAKVVDILHLEVYASLVCNCKKVKHGVARTAHGNVERHGVEECLASGYALWQNALVALFVIFICVLYYKCSCIFEQLYAVCVCCQNCSVARKSQADSLVERVHRVGSKHT